MFLDQIAEELWHRINDKTYRKEGYAVSNNGVILDKIVHWYDSEEYEVSTLSSSAGRPNKIISPKWFRCDICKGKFPIKEFMDTWDWAGPHCPNPNCGNEGMTLFSKISKPIVTARASIIYKQKVLIDDLEAAIRAWRH